jgi:hypothetical protein
MEETARRVAVVKGEMHCKGHVETCLRAAEGRWAKHNIRATAWGPGVQSEPKKAASRRLEIAA